MNSWLVVLWSIFLLCLSSCALQEHTRNNSVVNECKMVCTQRFDSCKQNCIDNCPTCSAISRASTASNYAKYVHEQQVQGGFVMRGLKSYHDPLQCRKVTCNCPSDFITCNQGCTGVIQKKLRSVPYCT